MALGYQCQGPEFCFPATLKGGSDLACTHWHTVQVPYKYYTEKWYFLLLPGLGVEAKHWNE